VTRLEHAKNMLERGLISDAECEALKARIVTRCSYAAGSGGLEA
jgi:hypothetical protein